MKANDISQVLALANSHSGASLPAALVLLACNDDNFSFTPADLCVLDGENLGAVISVLKARYYGMRPENLIDNGEAEIAALRARYADFANTNPSEVTAMASRQHLSKSQSEKVKSALYEARMNLMCVGITSAQKESAINSVREAINIMEEKPDAHKRPKAS